MPKYNRTEFKTQVDSRLTPIVDLETKHKPLLKDDLSESILFKKDVIGATVIMNSANVSIDFSSIDLAVLDALTNSVNPNITVSNIENGQSVYIYLTKGINKGVSFTNATLVSGSRDLLPMNSCVFKVEKKNNITFVSCVNIPIVDTGWLDGEVNNSYVVDPPVSWIKAAQYGRIVVVTGQVELNVEPGSNAVMTLPSGVATPITDIYFGSIDGGAGGSASECIEWKLNQNSRNIICVDPRFNEKNSFNFTYIAG